MPRATPGARRLANDVGIELEGVIGTGKSNYIVEADVLAVIAATTQANGKSTADAHEYYDGEVLPVSALFKLRFCQDDGEGNLIGEDLLAVRPKTVGGKFRSHAGVMGWFVADRGFFANDEIAFEGGPSPKADTITGPDHEASEGLEISG